MRRAGVATVLLSCLALGAGDDVPSLPEILRQDFRVVTVGEETVPLAALLEPGRPAVIEFWATWCPPCRKTLPELVKLKTRYGDRLSVLGLTVEDAASDLAKVRGFAGEYHVNFEIAFAPGELFRFMNRRPDIAVPKLFVFDEKGALVSYLPRYSAATSRKLRSAVARVLE